MVRLRVFDAFLLYVLVTLSSSLIVEDQSLVVSTTLGSYRGFVRKSVTNNLVEVFYGIPFAEPPIGSNRYKPPFPVKPHNSTLDCREQAPACAQTLFSFIKFHPFLSYYFGLGAKTPSEDCLYLNVFVPKNGGSNLPVMVWIFGGGYVMGSANFPVNDGTTLAAEENVIVVTINYRLNLFGFLYLGMDEAPGNMGLMDQAMALRWVRDHIGSFGGDPEKVTLFGQSAGSCSVGHHMMLDSSRPLFKRAILQSGAPHMPGCVDTRKALLEAAAKLADNLGCPFKEGNLKATLKCFLSKDTTELLDNHPIYGQTYNFFFKPVVDRKYIKEHPELTVRKGLDFIKMPILIGNARDENTVFMLSLFPFVFTFTEKLRIDEQDFRDVLIELLGITNDSVIINLTKNLYNDVLEKDNIARMLKITIRSGTDKAFFCPSLQFEDAMVNAGNKVFKYRFKYRAPNAPFPKWMGVVHGSELNHVFGEPLDPNKTFEADSKLLSRRMMRYWANFARTGDPNVSPAESTSFEKDELPFWQPLNGQEGNYLTLDVTPSLVTGFTDRRSCYF